MSKPPPPVPTASAIGPCPTVIKIVGRPGTGSLPSTIAPPDHPRLPRKGVVRLTDRPDMTIDVYRGRTTTTHTGLSEYLPLELYWGPEYFPLEIFLRSILRKRWAGGAMAVGKLRVPGCPTNLDASRARAYCACSRFVLRLFGLFFSRLSLLPLSLSLSLSGRRPRPRHRLQYCLKGPLNPNNQQTIQPFYATEINSSIILQ